MRATVRDIIRQALEEAVKDGRIGSEAALPDITVEKPKKDEFGDFATNIAMLLAPLSKRKPRDVASIIAEKIGSSALVEKCEVAGPGFINIFLKKAYWFNILAAALEKGPAEKRLGAGKGQKALLEFVSANPTGPLHIGHGRGAAVGDAMARLLKAAGYDVVKEFYINDVGRQMETLGKSVYLRYLELMGREIAFEGDLYKGEYIKEAAADFLKENGESYGARPEKEAIAACSAFAGGLFLKRIKKDLADFGVEFDVWYSEKALHEKGLVADTIGKLGKQGALYESEGALWFRTTDYGDDKDRVLRKAGGEKTYFASDIAYHREKLERGFSMLINVWGADHHGYEGRIRALIKALGKDDSALKVIFIQLVALLRNGAAVPMGKREGEFVTLRQVMDEVGADACRFFFLMRRSDAHLDFDLELAKKQAPENPVYYVHYCHARIQSIIAFAAEKGIGIKNGFDHAAIERLVLKEELDIIRHLSLFDETVEKSAAFLEPHRVTFYLTDLAAMFHPYYNKNRVVTEDTELSVARLLLCRAVRDTVARGLGLLGVSAPDKM